MADVSTTTAPVSPESNGQAQVEREQVQTAWVGAINEETGTGVQVAVKSTEDENGNTTYQVQGANGQQVEGLELSQDQTRLLSDDNKENDAQVYDQLRSDMASLQFAPGTLYDLQAEHIADETLTYDPKINGQSAIPGGLTVSSWTTDGGEQRFSFASGDQTAQVAKYPEGHENAGEPISSRDDLESLIQNSLATQAGLDPEAVDLGKPDIETKADREEATDRSNDAKPRDNESPNKYLDRIDHELYHAKNDPERSEAYLKAGLEYISKNYDDIMSGDDENAKRALLNLADDVLSGAVANGGAWDGRAYSGTQDIEDNLPRWKALAEELGEPAGSKLLQALKERHENTQRANSYSGVS